MPYYRLPQLMRALLDIYGGNVLRLHTELLRVTKDNCKIARPKLMQLCTDKDGKVRLSGAELCAIDELVANLKRNGKADDSLIGLSESSILSKADTMEAIEKCRKPVLFVLGSRRSECAGRTVQDIRSWDCRSMGQVFRIMGRLRNVHVQVADCRPTMSDHELQRSTWFATAQKDKTSIISIGSVHACGATEWLLSHMFGLVPFKPGNLASKLPFYFIWSPRIAKDLVGSTSLGWQDIRRVDSSGAVKVQSDLAWGMRIGEEMHYILKDRTGAQPMPGVFAAQGQPDGQVFVAICGITGPATFAVASILKEIKDELPFRSQNEPGRVLWGAVKVEAVLEEKVEVADSSDISVPTWLVPPEIWPK